MQADEYHRMEATLKISHMFAALLTAGPAFLSGGLLFTRHSGEDAMVRSVSYVHTLARDGLPSGSPPWGGQVHVLADRFSLDGVPQAVCRVIAWDTDGYHVDTIDERDVTGDTDPGRACDGSGSSTMSWKKTS